ncbi:hypothetical protein BGX21_010156 [Mortierella sp. AD011]|nr:hypothetical protein BGX20_010092 [Mortierella sp. AD010]KAF9394956.1 hypothetical protein BGX21_010156 [Mortierella sp. AD011]
MINIFSLPEIASAISQFLNRDDLHNCVLVHSLWFDRFTPHLWQTIQCTLVLELDPEPHAPEEEEKQAFITNNRRIRTLRTNNFHLAKTALEYCTHLRHIHIPYYIRAPFNAQFFRESVAPAMKRNPKLETLVYKCFPVPSRIHGGALPLFKLMLEPLHTLTNLHLTFHTEIGQEALMYLARFAKQLHRLKLGVGYVIDSKSLPMPSDAEVVAEQTQLRQLDIDGSTRGGVLEFLIPLIKVSSNLERLVLSYRFWGMEAPVAQTIRQNCPRLRHLILDASFTNLSDNKIANLIDSCRTPGLQTFELREPKGFEMLSLQALYEHSATLESVHIPNHHGSISEIVQRLLTQCPNLRVLDTSSKRYDRQQQTPAEGLLKEPWVCTKLEVFRVVLDGVFGNYPDGDEEDNEYSERDDDDDGGGYISPYHELSERESNHCADDPYQDEEGEGDEGDEGEYLVYYDYHWDLYTQLSRLTRLEELSVGFSLWGGAICESAPQFSLEGGLEMLEGLRQLRVLDVSHTRNGIQRQELEWMCEHWQKLERIEGIRMSRAASWWESSDNSLARYETLMPVRIRSILTAEKDNLAEIYD